jgi:hypothetical protein
MATIKITKADLIGNIKNFPIEVVEKMVEEQVRQGNKANVKVFQKYRVADSRQGGFCWDRTDDGSIFWHCVIMNEYFDVFFEKYPKADSKVYIIGDSEIGIDIIKTLEDRGGVNKYDLKGTDDGVIYYIDPMTNFITLTDIDSKTYNVVTATFKCIEAEEHKIAVSIQKIAEILGVEANRIVIKA